MTEERWKKTYDFMVEAGLLKPEVDWKKAFTDEFVKDLKIDVTVLAGRSISPWTPVFRPRMRQTQKWSAFSPWRMRSSTEPRARLARAMRRCAGGRGPLGGQGFRERHRALAPIDLTVREGEFVSLIGPSGCGKSTLLKLVASLLEPSDGRIAAGGASGFAKVGETAARSPSCSRTRR